MRVHIGATWQIRLNRPCAAAMRAFCQITLATCSVLVPCMRMIKMANCRTFNARKRFAYRLQSETAIYSDSDVNEAYLNEPLSTLICVHLQIWQNIVNIISPWCTLSSRVQLKPNYITLSSSRTSSPGGSRAGLRLANELLASWTA